MGMSLRLQFLFYLYFDSWEGGLLGTSVCHPYGGLLYLNCSKQKLFVNQRKSNACLCNLVCFFFQKEKIRKRS